MVRSSSYSVILHTGLDKRTAHVVGEQEQTRACFFNAAFPGTIKLKARPDETGQGQMFVTAISHVLVSVKQMTFTTIGPPPPATLAFSMK